MCRHCGEGLSVAVKRIYCYVKWDLLLCRCGYIVVAVGIYYYDNVDLSLYQYEFNVMAV